MYLTAENYSAQLNINEAYASLSILNQVDSTQNQCGLIGNQYQTCTILRIPLWKDNGEILRV